MHLGLLCQIPTRVFSADQVLANYIYVFFTAFLVSFFCTPAMRVVAIHFGMVDRPDLVRKIHRAPVAYLGGVAVFFAWLCGLFVSQFMMLHRIDPGWPVDRGVAHPIVPFSIVMGAVVIVTLGLVDDARGLKPGVKISGQILAAIFLLGDGIGIDATRPLLQAFSGHVTHFVGYAGNPSLLSPDWLVYVTSGLVVIAIVVGCCNASNLMDGLDGLCGGVTAIIALGFLIVATQLAMVGGGINTNRDAIRVIMALALLGAVLGFIPYNFNPASIFMGDTGSMFLGFACAAMMIEMSHEHSKWFLASMVMFALPILDTSLAFARRYLNGRPLFSADRQHIHHQLLARGLTINQAVLASYALAIVFGVLGTSMLFMRTRYAIALYLVIFGYLIVMAYKIGMVHERVQKSDASSIKDQSAESFRPDIRPATTLEVGALKLN
ncbi:MAG TPA: MraY family glycosyltransferase [Tepidisphaeraceae bacterium]|jgi:UDP-GlcNAc:undecaprenyl-phosphate GlcNAc-1-phosphate transferase|nr:MraY family glycosyltransferase [Tepidisphaeraceae bacterium]